jgi:hypothetical protein
VVPVAKVLDPLGLGHFRPISSLPALPKALEIVMRDQMVAYLTDVGALSPLESGFRPGHSTVTALLNITDDIYGMLDQGYFVALVLLDFSKTFDHIDHLLLCRKMESRYGCSSSVVSFRSYLSLRFQ